MIILLFSVILDEEQSDVCMAELIGSHKAHGKSCDISSKCTKTMTTPGLVGYGITHQVLWTMLAEMVRYSVDLEMLLS